MFNFSFFSVTGWGINLDYCDIEWFALETNRDHSVIFEPFHTVCGDSGRWIPYHWATREVLEVHFVWNQNLFSEPDMCCRIHWAQFTYLAAAALWQFLGQKGARWWRGGWDGAAPKSPSAVDVNSPAPDDLIFQASSDSWFPGVRIQAFGAHVSLERWCCLFESLVLSGLPSLLAPSQHWGSDFEILSSRIPWLN